MAKAHEHRWGTYRGSNVPGQEEVRCAGCFKLKGEVDKTSSTSTTSKPDEKKD